ncbi:MAG TPA: glycosyltransferase, partial [Acetobacteraceae bacterium]|nr:glycosyltransferase [Acetobacteraceae bacterium]
RTRNSTTIIGLLDADQGITPTAFQADLFPEPLRSRIVVLHEGVDTDLICPSPGATVTLDASGLTLRPGDELVTFVNRDLEPYRGYHIFMRALPRILARRPKARAILVGGDGVSYGAAAPPGKNWRNIFFNEVRERLDTSRVHFVGRVPHQTLQGLMQVTAAHVYLTYPFVLSWSMLEAMSAGALVIGSRTPPVEEVITHGSNGILCDFFDVEGLADAVIDALADQPRYQPLRDAARRSVVARYDLKRVCLPAWLSLCRGPAPPIVR